MSGIGRTQNIIREPYVDRDWVAYMPMSQQPGVERNAGKGAY
jgi:hypothetical protein